jgi:signal transduction histidine kinase
MKYLVSICLIVFSVNIFASEENLNCSKFVLVDNSNSLDINSVANSKGFAEIKNEKMTFGFTPYKHWISIQCSNVSSEKFIGKFQFLYPVIDILNIYNSKFEKVSSLGFRDRVLNDTNETSILPQFDLNIKANETVQFYVEAQTKGSLQLQSKIITHDQIPNNLISPSFYYGLFFGALLALMLYNLFFGLSLKDATYFYYCGYVIFFFMYQITITGYGATFFGKAAFFISTYRAAWLHLLFFFITIFARRFLLLDQHSPKLSKLLKFLSVIYGVTALLTPVLPTQGNLEFSAITSIIVPLILIIVASIVLKKGFQPARFFVIAWVLFLSAIVVTAMRNIGLLPKVWWVDHILEFGILGEVFLISLGLAFKMRLLEREKNQAATDVINESLKVVELNSQLEKEKLFSSISAQVSHDIRSPLSALTMVSRSLQDIPEEKRLLIRNASQRINDIANQLLMKSKQTNDNSESPNGFDTNRVELLSGIVDVLVSEKRIQYRDKLGISIVAELQESYGLFASVNPTELKRVLSNLINNSVEAFDQSSGVIHVGINQSSDEVCLYVKDNGKGIPPHILEKLGQAEISHGKEGTESGNGLGVYHAIKTIESFGGKLLIDSSIGKGTTITINFKKAQTPSWFVEKLRLAKDQYFVCIDDDVSIHQIWIERLESLKAKNHGIKLINLSSAEALANWLNSVSKDQINNSIFLVDYELLGQSLTGLDLIEKFELAQKAILVTSRFEEINIRVRCASLGVKLIPKGIASLVPIELDGAKIKYDACLIDDDELIHMVWNHRAKETGAKIRLFFNAQELIKELPSIDPKTKLYIDNQLSNGIKGTDVAFQLFNFGFEELYLSTGSSAEDFKSFDFLKGIVGKEPVW